MQAETDTRVRARLFYMELLSSERAFNGWNDEQAATASGQHFGRLLELLKNVSGIVAYPPHVRRGTVARHSRASSKDSKTIACSKGITDDEHSFAYFIA